MTDSMRQSNAQSGLAGNCDPVWAAIREDAENVVRCDPAMGSFLYTTILNHDTLEAAVSQRIADRLDHPSMDGDLIRQAYSDAFDSDPQLKDLLRADIGAVIDRDPVCDRMIEPILYFKGFHAIQAHRLANWLWHQGRRDFALYVQSRASEVFQVDIHPMVPVGKGVFIDHGTGIVVGSTAVIEDDVSILQNVTLGGTGKTGGDRHPKIRRGVLIGAGAKILGNIEIGSCSRVAAGSVVLKPVPSETTVAGVPARVVGQAGCSEPSRSMDHTLADD
ncbi:serine O-acetyltransferase [Coralliovum pocilloporae]|uniref:serine O-acetyltransferase n=1 Tax=Coralliovum pocilloporae TaxID=3066369 RepID=UPI00330717FA